MGRLPAFLRTKTSLRNLISRFQPSCRFSLLHFSTWPPMPLRIGPRAKPPNDRYVRQTFGAGTDYFSFVAGGPSLLAALVAIASLPFVPGHCPRCRSLPSRVSLDPYYYVAVCCTPLVFSIFFSFAEAISLLSRGPMGSGVHETRARYRAPLLSAFLRQKKARCRLNVFILHVQVFEYFWTESTLDLFPNSSKFSLFHSKSTGTEGASSWQGPRRIGVCSCLL